MDLAENLLAHLTTAHSVTNPTYLASDLTTLRRWQPLDTFLDYAFPTPEDRDAALAELTRRGYLHELVGDTLFHPSAPWRKLESMMRTLIVEPEAPQEAEQTSPPNLPFSPAPQVPSRPSWDETGISLARVFAARSMDEKIRVGCVILSSESKTLISGGLNGRYPGCPVESRRSHDQGASEFLHAEQQAIARARWEPGEKATLYTTVEPCHECALLILAARHINRVVFETPYAGDGKRRRGADILREAGVEVMQWRG